MSITSISDQQRHQERLFFRKNLDESLEIADTSASEKLEKFGIAVARLYDVDDVFPLRPGDAAHRCEPRDESNVGGYAVQQLNTVDIERTYPCFIQRTNITKLSTNICTYRFNYTSPFSSSRVLSRHLLGRKFPNFGISPQIFFDQV